MKLFLLFVLFWALSAPQVFARGGHSGTFHYIWYHPKTGEALTVEVFVAKPMERGLAAKQKSYTRVLARNGQKFGKPIYVDRNLRVIPDPNKK